MHKRMCNASTRSGAASEVVRFARMTMHVGAGFKPAPVRHTLINKLLQRCGPESEPNEISRGVSSGRGRV